MDDDRRGSADSTVGTSPLATAAAGGPPAVVSADGEETPTPSYSRAAEYRRRRARRRTPRKILAAEIAIFVLVVIVLEIATAPPSPSANATNPGGNGGPVSRGIQVQFAKPTVDQPSCGVSGNVTVEHLRVESTSVPLTTKQVTLLLVELGDGDVLGSVTTPPHVTSSSVCADAPPSGDLGWYGVLASPSGANLAAFTYNQGWSPVAGAPFPGPITNGSAIALVFTESVAGFGYGVQITGVVGGPVVSGLGLL